MKQMYIDLTGKTVLITGGGTGIGHALSLGFANCGCNVAVNYSKSKAEAENTAETIRNNGGNAKTFRADVTNEQQVRSLIDEVCERFGEIDILVANAGTPTEICPTVELSAEQWDRGLSLNCKSIFFCVKHCVPRFPKSGGRIIITSSISARSGGGPGMITYAAAKGAVNNMVRGWAKEFAPQGITVNAIAPGVIRTRIHEKNTSPDEYKKLITRIPLGRDGVPEDCVGSVLLLASDQGSYITGQIIEINGGMQMP